MVKSLGLRIRTTFVAIGFLIASLLTPTAFRSIAHQNIGLKPKQWILAAAGSMKIYRRQENGIYYIRLPGGVKRSLNTRDPHEAKLFGNAIKARILRGDISGFQSESKITLSHFIKLFLEDINGKAVNTQAAYGVALRALMDAIGGDFEFGRIDGPTIKKFTGLCKARKLTDVSINSYLRHIRAALRSDVARAYLPVPPKIRIEKPKEILPRVLSSSEKDFILLHALNCDPRMHGYINFALLTGARRDEIHTLKWENVSSDSCKVTGKGGKQRTIPLIRKAIAAMGRPLEAGFVFHHFKDVDTITHKFKAITRACGIEDVHFHILRHTAATNMLASGMRLEYVQEMLGHSSIAVTRIYAHILRADLARELRKFENELEEDPNLVPPDG